MQLELWLLKGVKFSKFQYLKRTKSHYVKRISAVRNECPYLPQVLQSIFAGFA
jgi:hypothetical protein